MQLIPLVLYDPSGQMWQSLSPSTDMDPAGQAVAALVEQLKPAGQEVHPNSFAA